MQKRLTITMLNNVRRTIRLRKISELIQELIRYRVVHPKVKIAYAEMARDKKREKEALEWAELYIVDADQEAVDVW